MRETHVMEEGVTKIASNACAYAQSNFQVFENILGNSQTLKNKKINIIIK